MKKTVLFLLMLCLVLAATACGKNGDASRGAPTKLSFKSASGYAYLKSLNGKQVTINGYMATSSPADGSFIFLMNLPYQSCPFCKPNTTQLSNTMEVYPKKNEKFDYTTQAVKVTGTLTVAADENKPFTDKYGYEFNFKIEDAEYHILKDDELSGEIALWQKIADSGIISDIYTMYDYVNFVCAWNTYFVNNFKDADGKLCKGYYLYASDAQYLMTTDGAQWNYGYKPDYFTKIAARLEKFGSPAMDTMVANVKKAETLARKAEKELLDGNYTFEYKYVDKFEQEDYLYSINKGKELDAEMQDIYQEFSNWLGAWEM